MAWWHIREPIFFPSRQLSKRRSKFTETKRIYIDLFVKVIFNDSFKYGVLYKMPQNVRHWDDHRIKSYQMKAIESLVDVDVFIFSYSIKSKRSCCVPFLKLVRSNYAYVERRKFEKEKSCFMIYETKEIKLRASNCKINMQHLQDSCNYLLLRSKWKTTIFSLCYIERR